MKKIYFLSDAHLGSRAVKDSRAQEMRLCRFLESIMDDAQEVYMLGDMFDFWFEYHNVVPKGFTRFLGTLSRMTDLGVRVHYFIGNHDIWTFDYLEKECGVILHRHPELVTLPFGGGMGRGFFLAHGDALGDGDAKFLFVRRIFHSRVCQWLFRNILPADLGIELGLRWARNNRMKHPSIPYQGENEEPLIRFAKQYLKNPSNPVPDYFIFGHRHLPFEMLLTHKTSLIILGDWVNDCTYAVWDGRTLSTETAF